LRDFRSQGARRQNDGELRPDQQGVRRRMLDVRIADVYGQPVCKAVLQAVRRHLRRLREGMRKAQRRSLQKVRAGVPQLRRRMQKDGSIKKSGRSFFLDRILQL
jgi:G:T/U-mismatch repair DNA glycosylase